MIVRVEVVVVAVVVLVQAKNEALSTRMNESELRGIEFVHRAASNKG